MQVQSTSVQGPLLSADVAVTRAVPGGNQYQLLTHEAALLRHPLAGQPHIVAAHGVLVKANAEHEITGVVLELAHGSVSSMLGTGQPLSCHQRHRIAQQCFSALDAAHVKGYAHLDIKPENILVWHQPDSSVFDTKVADWGLALGTGFCTSKCGTPGYTAPEVLLAEQDPVEVDPRADVYSAEVMLLELAASTRVLEAFQYDIDDITLAVLNQSFIAMTVTVAQGWGEPQWLRLVQWCCHADLQKRPFPGQVLSYLQGNVVWGADGQPTWRDDAPLPTDADFLDLSVTVRTLEVLIRARCRSAMLSCEELVV